MNYAERFWTKVDKSGECCWNWTAGLKKPELYGKFKLNKRTLMAHRVSYSLSHPLTFDLLEGHREICVCHRCDNPMCVNPAHLFLGTMKDNMIDKTVKGRGKGYGRGEKHILSKLTENDVREIRLRAGGITHRELALEYGVSRSLVGLIILRKTWSHI